MTRWWMRIACLSAFTALAIGCGSPPDGSAPDGSAVEPEAPDREAQAREAPNPTPESGRPASAPPRATAGISWFGGTLEAAFASAASTGQPLFLYWGADWCPYCADLEAHVLSRADVQAKLAAFIPVYLNGDEPGAQRAADRLAVAGYPTVLVLDGAGTEMARLSGGLDLGMYAELLDLVLADMRPIEQVLAAARERALTPPECRRLAYHAFGLEDAAVRDPGELSEHLERAAAMCPVDARDDRARLMVAAALAAVEADPAATAAPTQHLVTEVVQIAADQALAVRTADALQSLDGAFFDVVEAVGPSSGQAFLRNLDAAMAAAARDERYGVGDRLLALRTRVEAWTALDAGGAPPALIAEARQSIDANLAAVGRSPARPGAVNAAINLLVAFEDYDSAYVLAEGELESSRTPYYAMADLAWLDERLGRTASAISWLERAYRSSAGAATRFQWGTNYVRGLLRMAPDNESAIVDAATEVLAELDAPGALYRRTRARLLALDDALRAWNADGRRSAAEARIRGRIVPICDTIAPDEADALSACRAFAAG